MDGPNKQKEGWAQGGTQGVEHGVSKPVGKLRLVDTKQIGGPSNNITHVEVFCRDEADNVFSFKAEAFNKLMKAC